MLAFLKGYYIFVSKREKLSNRSLTYTKFKEIQGLVKRPFPKSKQERHWHKCQWQRLRLSNANIKGTKYDDVDWTFIAVIWYLCDFLPLCSNVSYLVYMFIFHINGCGGCCRIFRVFSDIYLSILSVTVFGLFFIRYLCRYHKMSWSQLR